MYNKTRQIKELEQDILELESYNKFNNADINHIINIKKAKLAKLKSN